MKVPHEVKIKRALAKRTSEIMKNGQDVIQMLVLGAPDRVNIPGSMHDTRFCEHVDNLFDKKYVMHTIIRDE